LNFERLDLRLNYESSKGAGGRKSDEKMEFVLRAKGFEALLDPRRDQG
jgi:hypothetical protein